MFEAQRKYTGTGYTTTVALLVVAFILIPAVLIISRPLGHTVVAVAVACSMLCAALAWIFWDRFSRLTIPSIETDDNKASVTKAVRLIIPLVCAAFGVSMLQAGDFSSYRGLPFGMSLATAAKQMGKTPADARILHRRPALIQEMDWQSTTSPLTDPVREGLLSFYNGELFRIVITYDRYKVEGLTADDLIELLSTTYGTPTRPSAEVAYHSIYGETAPVVGRWEDPEYSYNLLRSGESYALVMYTKRLDTLAQASIAEAVRLDAQEAPQREIEQQKKKQDDEHLSLEKARATNRPNFRP